MSPFRSSSLPVLTASSKTRRTTSLFASDIVVSLPGPVTSKAWEPGTCRLDVVSYIQSFNHEATCLRIGHAKSRSRADAAAHPGGREEPARPPRLRPGHRQPARLRGRRRAGDGLLHLSVEER